MRPQLMSSYNFLSNPSNTLLLPGGNFDGLDRIANSSYSSVPITTHKGRVIFRCDKNPMTYWLIFNDCPNVASNGVWLLQNGAVNLSFRAYSSNGKYSHVSFAYSVGGIYDVSWSAVCGDSTPSISVVINGVSYTGTESTGTLTNPRCFIGSITTSGIGKIPYLEFTRNGVLGGTYAPSIYGTSGTTNCGNGWTLTDGSPTTFWT